MSVMPDPQFKFQDMIKQIHGRRELLFWSDFLGWPGPSTEQITFGITNVTGTPAAQDNGEGGWAALGGTGTDATYPKMRSIPPNAAGSSRVNPTENPSVLFRGRFAPASADITCQGMGFSASAAGNSVASDLAAVTGGGNIVGLGQTSTGNLFFRSSDNALVYQSTDLGAVPTQDDEWEIRTIDSGVSWQCLRNGVVVANHSTRVPITTALLRFETGLDRTAGAHVILLDWIIAECDKTW